MKKPDFIGIGSMRCGTTWLDKMLRLHPKINMPIKKEIHYFDWNYDKGDKWYLKQFSNQGIAGEITPGYCIINNNRLKEFHKLLPETKILLLLRNPMNRAYSHALFDFQKKGIKPTYKHFINHFQSKKSIIKGSYCNIIDKWKKYYYDNMMIVISEMMFKYPQDILNNIYKFLEVNEFAIPKPLLNRKISSTNNSGIPENLQPELYKIYHRELENLRKKHYIIFNY